MVVGGLVVVVVVVDVVDVALELVVVGALVVEGGREVGDALGDVGGATGGATGAAATELVLARTLEVVVDSIVVVDSSGASVDPEPEVVSGG